MDAFYFTSLDFRAGICTFYAARFSTWIKLNSILVLVHNTFIFAHVCTVDPLKLQESYYDKKH